MSEKSLSAPRPLTEAEAATVAGGVWWKENARQHAVDHYYHLNPDDAHPRTHNDATDQMQQVRDEIQRLTGSQDLSDTLRSMGEL
ncbi:MULTISPECIES: hypothetical protein [Roseomonadaceae]|uniref:Uncharacterized protein n=1 Tax=Falsiroseomonas oleicola TaxID=2801474 RepID=A0ABS6H6U3_9PROT|nr:hypothetical protein [Roseomonas oleicola]MBU8544086.1 hypothetical protein [Roseomonas oleicola]